MTQKKGDLLRWIDVIPFVALPPRSNQIYTYRLKKKETVAVGQIVSIPFSGRTIEGIVWRSYSEAVKRKKISYINKVVSPPLFSSSELEWLSRLAELSLESLAMLVKRATAVRSINPKPDVQERIKRSCGKIIVDWSSDCNALIDNATKKQVLILVPEKIFSATLLKSFHSPVPVLEYAQTMRIKERRMVVRHISEDKSCVVVSTHSGIFLPFQSLDRIIVYEASLSSHRQWDLHPRYDARTAALLLGHTKGIPVVFTDTLISSDLLALNDRISKHNTPKTLTNFRASIIRRSRNDQDLLLPETVQAIKRVIRQKKSVFLFHDIVGEQRDYRCGSCWYTLRCERCGGILERKGRATHCRSCGLLSGSIPTFCPKCSSPRMEPKVMGTVALEQRVKGMFPGISVVRIDRETFPPSASTFKASVKVPTIVIGTERAFATPLPHFSLSTIIDADSLMAGNLYNTSEKALRLIMRIGWYTTPPLHKTMLIQTSWPEIPLFTSLSSGTLPEWIHREMDDRKMLQFPPFGAMLRFTRDFAAFKHGENACRKVMRDASLYSDIRAGWRLFRTRTGYRGDVIAKGAHVSLWKLLSVIKPTWSVDPVIPVTEANAIIAESACKNNNNMVS